VQLLQKLVLLLAAPFPRRMVTTAPASLTLFTIARSFHPATPEVVTSFPQMALVSWEVTLCVFQSHTPGNTTATTSLIDFIVLGGDIRRIFDSLQQLTINIRAAGQ